MDGRRRSKRIAALDNSFTSSLTGSILVKRQQSSSKRVKTKRQIVLENQQIETSAAPGPGIRRINHSAKQLKNSENCRFQASPKKCVSFSPCSVVVDGIGERTETPLAISHDDVGQPNSNGRNSAFNQRYVVLGETLTAAELAVLTGTDNCAMDDDVFEGDKEPDGYLEGQRLNRYQYSLYEADYTMHEDNFMSTKSWIALFFIVILMFFIVISFMFPELFVAKFDHHQNDYAVHWKENKGIFLLAFLGCLLSASLVGCGCGCFSWMVTYFDSLEPGIVPPTPLSPGPIRMVSPHKYHFGYVMSVLNGFAMFFATIWWMRNTYLVT